MWHYLEMVDDLTILIANLGQIDRLRACLQSLFDADMRGMSFRVIVGFNFEGESDTPLIVAAEFPQVEQRRASMKLGYCRAYNELMAESSGRYALLLDDDTILEPGAIEGMIRFMDTHPQVGIAGCRTVNPDGSFQKTTARMFTLGTEIANILSPAAFWNDGVDETVANWRPVDWLNGHFLLVRTEVIRAVGGLDERFYTFQCEADWCLRIRTSGWVVAYVPDYTVMHVGGAHSNAPGVKSRRNLLRSHLNRYYFIRKHYGKASFHAFRAIMSIGTALRAIRYAAIWLLSPIRRGEAGPKVGVYTDLVLRGFMAHPEDLPDELRRDHPGSASF